MTALPVVVKNLTVDKESILGGDRVVVTVVLTAPAPQEGIRGAISFISSAAGEYPFLTPAVQFTVPGGLDRLSLDVSTTAVSMVTRAMLTALAPGGGYNYQSQAQANFEIRPSRIQSIESFDRRTFQNVPLGGIRHTVALTLEGPAGHLYGSPVALHYSGTTQISGPSRVVIPKDQRTGSFEVTISPCSAAPTCTMTIRANLENAYQSEVEIATANVPRTPKR